MRYQVFALVLVSTMPSSIEISLPLLSFFFRPPRARKNLFLEGAEYHGGQEFVVTRTIQRTVFSGARVI